MIGSRFLARAVAGLSALASIVNGYPVTTFAARHSRRQDSDTDILQL